MRRQRGSTLVLVLVVMVLLMLGALAAMRSADSSASVAGNAAFAAATKQAGDIGINAGVAYVVALAAPDVAVPNQYFALRQTEDADGLPAVSWADVTQKTVGNYTMQYVVERLCAGVLPVIETLTQCVTESQPMEGSNRLGSDVYSTPPSIVYRITVRTRGPKNAESYSQALISK